MLEPEGRHALLDALRPPPGFTLDRAVGTTFSLDLMALLTAPLAFALYDRTLPDGEGMDLDPIALLEAVRRHADRLDIFCQAGQIAPMGDYRPIVAYLERSIHPVVPRQPTAIFHPKVWFIRYRDADGDERRYRFLCLSRNLTFDRSWDTVLALDGIVGAPSSTNDEFAGFIAALAGLAVNGLDEDRKAAIAELAGELANVRFDPPPGFHDLRFWPMGHDGAARWPFEGRIDRMLVISPFLTAPLLQRLPGRRRQSLLVSRAETIDRLGGSAVAGYAELLTLNSDAAARSGETDEPGAATESLGEKAGAILEGLHAKFYLADAGWNARLWTGSANATDAAYGGNVEFLVELGGKKGAIGIDATLAERPGTPTLRSILEPYEPPNLDPQPASVEEDLDRELDLLRRAIGGLNFTASVTKLATDTYDMRLVGKPRSKLRLPSVEKATCRPMTSRGASSPFEVSDGAATVRFPALSFEGLTSFFVISLIRERDGVKRELDFVINAQLIGAPEDRRQRLLAVLLRNRQDLLRFLLMLLSDAGLQAALQAGAAGSAAWNVGAGGWQSLLEPMVHALSRDPSRIDDIAGLVNELMRTPEGQGVLPERWAEIWDPIWTARGEARP